MLIVTGVAGALADALSMGASGYLAAKSEAEVSARQVAIEKEEMRLMPDIEERELAHHPRGEGADARARRAKPRKAMMRDPKQALETKVQEELGIQPPSVTPLADGLVTGAATAVGALIPLVPFFTMEAGHGDLGVADGGHAGALRRRRGPQHLHRPRGVGQRPRHVPGRIRRCGSRLFDRYAVHGLISWGRLRRAGFSRLGSKS